jgi:tetratricopeptide (TPR) repeat protein
LFQATWGLYLNAARNQRLDKAELIGDELMTISREIGDEDLKFEALHHRWGFVYFMGQTEEMLRLAAEGIEQYDRDRHHKFTYLYAGHDPGACACCVRALALGLTGRARSMRPALEDGRTLANSLQHPLTLAFFNSVACFGLHMVGDAGGCREFAERLVQISSRYDFPATKAVGSFMLGAARALEGDIASALEQMEPSFEATFAYGFLGMLPGVIMADTLAGANRNQEALALVTRLLEGTRTPEEGVFVPELWRLRGELVLRQSADETRQAERHFGTAARMADKQGALVYRLRAGTQLSRLLAEEGRREEARAVLDRANGNPLDEWEGPEIGIATQLRLELD